MKKIIVWLGLSVVAFNLFSGNDNGLKNWRWSVSPFTILLQACLKGDLNQAASIIPHVKNLNKQMNDKKTTFVKKQLIKLYGIDAHSKIEYKMTPLILALSRGHKDIAKLLMGYGVDVNIQTEQSLSALMVAVQIGDKKIVEKLLQHKANLNLQEKDGFTALMIAVEQGYEEIVELLLQHKANPNLQEKDGCTALMIATCKGWKKIVELLLIYKADPDIQGIKKYSALMFAADQGHEEIAELLLQHNANPNLQRDNGCTALMGASYKGWKKIVELLLIYKADPDIQGVEKYSALMVAAEQGHEEIVELLLQHNANPNLQEENGHTALMGASYNGCKKIAELLLKYYANPNTQGKGGETALIVALFPDKKNRKQEKDVIETIKCLLEYDADTQLKLRERSHTINDVLNNADGVYRVNVENEAIEKLKMIIQSTYDLQKDGARNALIKYPNLKELLIKRMLKQGAQLYTNKVAQEAFSSELIDDKELRYKEGLEYIHNNYLSDLGKIYKNDYFKKQAVSQNCFEKYTARKYCFNNLKNIGSSGIFSDITILAHDN